MMCCTFSGNPSCRSYCRKRAPTVSDVFTPNYDTLAWNNYNYLIIILSICYRSQNANNLLFHKRTNNDDQNTCIKTTFKVRGLNTGTRSKAMAAQCGHSGQRLSVYSLRPAWRRCRISQSEATAANKSRCPKTWFLCLGRNTYKLIDFFINL